jgi:hypothetical protein
MLQPFLFIGVGGSGGKTLRVLREELEHRLSALGWEDPFPAAWQFLHVDVPSTPDGLDPDLPRPLPDECYVGLAGQQVEYGDLDGMLRSRGERDPEILEALVGWRPNPQSVTLPIARGAGQYRAIGRVVAAAQLGELGRRIEVVVNRLDQTSVPPLRELTRRMQFNADGPAPDPQVVLVTSLAGGSGSGVFLDVCDALRTKDVRMADNAMGLVFAPDIFSELPAALAPGVQPNTLAALSELMAAYWNQENDPDSDTNVLLTKSGHPVMPSNQHGLARPFLIGATNGQVTFGSQNDMYRAAGKTLAAMVLSESVQQQVGPYISAQWLAGASSQGASSFGLATEGGEPGVISSMGFAGVTLGRDRFAEYASERLARSALERLLRGHHDRDGEVSPDRRLEQETDDAAMEEFLRQCGLWELGEENNDVLDALRPGGAQSSFVAELKNLLRDVKAAVTQGRTVAQQPSVWAADVIQEIRERRRRYEADNTAARHELAKQWAVDIQVRIRDAVEQVMSVKGALVAAVLLEQLPAAIEQTIEELEGERKAKVNSSQRMEQAAVGEIEAFAEPMTADNLAIGKGAESGVKSISLKAEAELRETAIELLTGLRDGFVAPLAKAARRAYEDLKTEEESRTPEGEPAVSTTWPTEDGILPTKFEAAQNEVFIEPPSDFPDSFVEQVRLTTKPPGAKELEPPQTAISRATEAVITHIPNPRKEAAEHVIVFLEAWIPRRVEYRAEGHSHSTADFSLNLSLDWLTTRAWAWLHRPDDDNAIGTFVGEDLATYTDKRKVDSTARIQRLADALDTAISKSAPLAEINNGVLGATHDGVMQPEYISVFTEVPFSDRSDAGAKVTEVLVRHHIDPAKVRFSNGDQSRIDIFTVLSSPYHPVVYESLMKPMVAKWDVANANANARREFWRYRRSRQLSSFIPVSPEARRMMVRGWFLGRTIDQVAFDDSGVAEVYVPENRSYVSFPDQLLRGAVPAVDRLPAILESLLLAYMRFHVQPRDRTPLMPYARLLELGNYVEMSQSPLGRWIDRGQVDDKARCPKPALQGVVSTEARIERYDLARRTFIKTRDTFEADFAEPIRSDKTFYDVSLAWELRADIREAFRSLVEDLDQMRDSVTSVEDDEEVKV